MRVLLGSGDPRAAFAIDVFVRRILVEAGGAISAMGGIDALVFSGGIGEHASAIRSRIVDGLAWVGAGLDPVANAAGRWRLETDASAVAIRRIAVDEESIIAAATVSLVARDWKRTSP
jgi:acetate kinase